MREQKLFRLPSPLTDEKVFLMNVNKKKEPFKYLQFYSLQSAWGKKLHERSTHLDESNIINIIIH